MIGINRSVTNRGHNCTECGKPLPFIRDGWKEPRRTCSAKCRKRRERRQKEADCAYIGALHELQKIRDSLKRGEMVDKFRQDVIRVRDECNDLLLLAKDEDRVALREMLEARARKF